MVSLTPWLAIQTGFAGSLVGSGRILKTTLAADTTNLAATIYEGGLSDVIWTTFAGLLIAGILRSAYISGTLVALVEEWSESREYLSDSADDSVTEEIPVEIPMLFGHLDEVIS